jgi:hypothetical protein
MKAGAVFDASHSWASFIEMAAVNGSDELRSSIIGSCDASASRTDLPDLEMGRIGLAFRALFQMRQSQSFLREHDYLEPALRENDRVGARGIMHLPFYERWWELEKERRTYTGAFIGAIEAAESTEVVAVGSPRASSRGCRVSPHHCMRRMSQPVNEFACASVSAVWRAADAGC